ncbi:hypothetical protein [Paraglaciecola chathamensis]|uniref:hypothetical protein n=1 Tax=Paraglaciecola chathamensis TaxID=368405 RepID=UPI00270544C0|nr:hypothetical protein [Paraglaciecola chathamensis]MDO6559198.1 hypothetical protein [Paraglaciecola chathamensis]
MTALLTFVIPIRHQESAPNWDVTKKNLAETMRSISSQEKGLWRCIIVANEGADLPDMPDGFTVCRVNFPINKDFKLSPENREQSWEAVRVDKGMRILSGILFLKPTKYLMVVDDDDFLHHRLAAFVKENDGKNGWYIGNGYIWTDGGNLLLKYRNFNHTCGTSHIVKTSLLEIPRSLAEADIEYVKKMFGSHRFIAEELEKNGTPLGLLPFEGAVYRVGHADAHSKPDGIFKRYIIKKSLSKIVLHPKELVWTILRLRHLKLLTNSKRKQFFGRDI